LDEAIEAYRRGESSSLVIKVPPRHGKSEIVSRNLPLRFLCEFPDKTVLNITYSASLAKKFSKATKAIVHGKMFKKIFPKVELNKKDNSVEHWKLEGGLGSSNYMGILGSITGNDGDLIIVDDYCKGREEAESEVQREKVWEAFTNDILTRRSPVSILIVMATPWHYDDLMGRIKNKGKKEGFPDFKEIKFPVYNETTGKFLHEERFPRKAFYEKLKATVGKYAYQSLYLCDPLPRGGNIFDTSAVRIVDKMPSDIVWVRAWDLASSSKQRRKDDPDYTVGVKMGVQWVDGLVHVYIEDVVRGQWEAPQRNKVIVNTAKNDTSSVRQGIEAFAAYKDAYTTIKAVLKGVSKVEDIRLPGDKVAKASPLEPVFEAGNIYLKTGPWNESLKEEFDNFPTGNHDDIVDAVAVGYSMLLDKSRSGVFSFY
jgi:predicted phage terminase large subunit-like protein